MQVTISEVIDQHQKADIVKEVLTDLPEWFGLPASTKTYIEEARTLTLLAAAVDDEIVGFITMSPSSEETVEIHAMGVKKSLHRAGIGTKLFEAFETYVSQYFSYIQVKTVDEGHYPEYDQTIAFYREMGFSKLEVFPHLWDDWNPCLVMVKKVHVE